MIKILVDECLTPDLVDIARARWIEADHVSHIGRAGASDWSVLRMALEGNYTVVTNNARDFRRLYLQVDLHPGLKRRRLTSSARFSTSSTSIPTS